jgi:hypothetical protein
MEKTKIEHIKQVLQKFQDGYTKRDIRDLDKFMQLFLTTDDIELIGVGAKERNGFEWFQGTAAIKEIVEGDWTYWGDVQLDVKGAKITVYGDTAWLTTTGKLIQSSQHDLAMKDYGKQMRELLKDQTLEDGDAQGAILDAAIFGLKRLREKDFGIGHEWPFTFSAVLIVDRGNWKFHTIHWAMPVE